MHQIHLGLPLFCLGRSRKTRFRKALLGCLLETFPLFGGSIEDFFREGHDFLSCCRRSEAPHVTADACPARRGLVAKRIIITREVPIRKPIGVITEAIDGGWRRGLVIFHGGARTIIQIVYVKIVSVLVPFRLHLTWKIRFYNGSLKSPGSLTEV